MSVLHDITPNLVEKVYFLGNDSGRQAYLFIRGICMVLFRIYKHTKTLNLMHRHVGIKSV